MRYSDTRLMYQLSILLLMLCSVINCLAIQRRFDTQKVVVPRALVGHAIDWPIQAPYVPAAAPAHPALDPQQQFPDEIEG